MTTKIFTGIRPTGDLTVGNYLGAVRPIVELQEKGEAPLVFVADIHAITDKEPGTVREYLRGVVADYIALGVDPTKTKIYIQSDIMGEVTSLMAFLARLIPVAELLRVPTLKDKLRANENPENANALLLLYPVLMAADILINRAERVPVGEDQVAHIEVTRELANRFNKKYGKVFPVPQPLVQKSLRVLSLKGDGKMSKTSPQGALFLTDSAKEVEKKIRGAETAFEGKMSANLESHILIAKELARGNDDRAAVDAIIARHMKGEQAMGAFKTKFAAIVNVFLAGFQERRAEVMRDPAYIDRVLAEGAALARKNAAETLAAARKAMNF